ncbi:MAG: DNA polymerase III subunit gamma/tau [Gammaproteobacteria bacterium]|nr:DNA polymerase III subunit gamma/tau [Gammaproteobacteria bacterium]MCP5458488.1 DNA polymerase III subunit gamma/tau [Gammaproteobacteria bacterium]
MSYQVLARKWRPRTFQEVVGQDHVVRTLSNALNEQRLHHAFLFTGTRGVGKTTIARILAKALNCESGVTATPCGVCAACREIDEGRFVDLLEVDAASRTGVDDTRELLENVPYAPVRGRYKVYLIDEVHMFSRSSFNALLKTLEEPPPHVKFLLATTDPQRLPVTVLSRCLQFNLKSVPTGLIAKHLGTLLEREAIPHEIPAVRLLARAGMGSVRDALSLLDQAIAFGNGQVNLQEVNAMLGTLDQGRVLTLLEALAAGDAGDLIHAAAELEQTAPDYMAVLAELTTLLQHMALLQLVPDHTDEEWDDPERMRRLAAKISPEDVQLFYQIALLGRRDLPLVPEPGSGFEMILLRMLCFRPGEIEPVSVAPSRPRAASLNEAQATPKPDVQTPAPATIRSAAAQPRPAPRQTEDDSPVLIPAWDVLVDQLQLTGMAQQLALNCTLQRQEDQALHLLLAPAYAQTRTRNAEERLRTALQDHFGKPLRLHIRIGEAAEATPAERLDQQRTERRNTAWEAINNDPNVQALRDTFGAQVKPDSLSLDDE